MDELEALQAELAAVQASESVQRLSERNVVDVVAKLRAAGKVDLLMSVTGKELLTWDWLQRQAREEVLRKGGRARVDELATALNVELAHLERALRHVCEQDGDFRFVSAVELLSEAFLDEMALEVDDKLQGLGRMTVGQIATEYALPLDCVKNALQARVSGGGRREMIRARLQHGVLVTQAHDRAVQARVRGMLSAFTRPASLHAVAQATEMSLQDVEAFARQALLAQGTVHGGEFVPHVFTRLQRQSVDHFFGQNGYITESTARKFGLRKGGANLLAFVQDSFSDAVLLDSTVLAAEAMHALISSAQECVSGRRFFDLRTVLPAVEDLSELDLGTVVSRCKQACAEGAIEFVPPSFLVSLTMLDRVRDSVTQAASIQAQDAAEALSRERGSGVVSSDTIRARLDKETQVHCSRTSIKAMVRKAAPELHRVGSGGDGGQEEQASGDENDDDVAPLLKHLVRDVESDVVLAFRAHFQDLSESVHLSGAAALLKRQSALEQVFAELYVALQLTVKGFDKLRKVVPSQEEPLKTLATAAVQAATLEIAGLLVEHQCAQEGSGFPRKPFASVLHNGVRLNHSWTERATLQSALVELDAEEMVTRLQALLKLTETSQDLEALMLQVEEAARECHLIVRKVDKKAERNKLQLRRGILLNELAKTTSEEVALLLAGAVVMQQVKSVFCFLPNEIVLKTQELDRWVVLFTPVMVEASKALLPQERAELIRRAAEGTLGALGMSELKAFCALKNPAK